MRASVITLMVGFLFSCSDGDGSSVTYICCVETGGDGDILFVTEEQCADIGSPGDEAVCNDSSSAQGALGAACRDFCVDLRTTCDTPDELCEVSCSHSTSPSHIVSGCHMSATTCDELQACWEAFQLDDTNS